MQPPPIIPFPRSRLRPDTRAWLDAEVARLRASGEWSALRWAEPVDDPARKVRGEDELWDVDAADELDAADEPAEPVDDPARKVRGEPLPPPTTPPLRRQAADDERRAAVARVAALQAADPDRPERQILEQVGRETGFSNSSIYRWVHADGQEGPTLTARELRRQALDNRDAALYATYQAELKREPNPNRVRAIVASLYRLDATTVRKIVSRIDREQQGTRDPQLRAG